MSNADKVGYFFALVMLGLSLYLLGFYLGRDWAQQDAAIQGAGVYLADGKTGKTSFHWISP